jgi:Prefoldin subunit
MLSYPLDEAAALLTAKLHSARQNLANAKEDLDWLRDQITVTEVNVARVYNWDVKRRREKREREAAAP